MEEEKTLLLDFSDEYNLPQWSLVYDESFFHSEWLLKKEYNIYRTFEIKEKFFKKNTKLTEKKLKDMGFIKIESKTYDWAINWFFNFLGIVPLKRFFSDYSGKEKVYKFDDFVDMSCIEDEIYLVEDWLRYLLAIRWCKENGIKYKVKLYDGFPDTAKIKKIRKEILGEIANTTYIEPYEALNKLKYCIDTKNR